MMKRYVHEKRITVTFVNYCILTILIDLILQAHRGDTSSRHIYGGDTSSRHIYGGATSSRHIFLQHRSQIIRDSHLEE